jgi:NitT/TauT family transport system permease protein
MSRVAFEADTQAPSAEPLPQNPPATRDARTPLKAVGVRVLSVLLIFALWELVSRAVTTSVFPTPAMTWHALQDALADGYVWSDMMVTFGRMLAAFALAMALAITFGLALGTIGWFGRMFDFWVTIAASIPSLLYIVVVYLWLGLNDRAAIVAAGLVVAPSATFNVWQGVKSIDPGLSEMARAFRVPRWMIVRRVLFPQTVPYLFAAARSSLALTWKVVIFVELMGRSTGVGYRIQYWYHLFNMERVLASAVLFMLVMLIIELVVVRNLEQYLFRWRREEAR